MKSTCLALFSATWQVTCPRLRKQCPPCEQIGRTTVSERNKSSLNVSKSPIGFFQNNSIMSSGHQSKGKKASPFMKCRISLLSSKLLILKNKDIFLYTTPESLYCHNNEESEYETNMTGSNDGVSSPGQSGGHPLKSQENRSKP